MLNGEFAQCPKCQTVTAKNAAGYWKCIFGCGYKFRTNHYKNLKHLPFYEEKS